MHERTPTLDTDQRRAPVDQRLVATQQQIVAPEALSDAWTRNGHLRVLTRTLRPPLLSEVHVYARKSRANTSLAPSKSQRPTNREPNDDYAMVAADDLVAQRDLNCLADDNRQTRKRALTKLAALPTSGHPPELLATAWTDTLRSPILKLFADPVEKNRELAITLATEMVAALPDTTVTDSLSQIVPAVVARIGGSEVAESAEELRLQLLELVEALVKRCGSALAAHLTELVTVLVASYNDPFPDAKKSGCTITVALAEATPSHIETHCATLINGLASSLAHQHSRVRSMATEALFALLLREPSLLAEARCLPAGYHHAAPAGYHHAAPPRSAWRVPQTRRSAYQRSLVRPHLV